MLLSAHPKLPMIDKLATKAYYLNELGFEEIGDYGDYWMIEKEGVELHFFEFKALDPHQNYGQVYIRTNEIENLYQSLLDRNVAIHPNGHLRQQPWGQQEFSLLDPNHNLITFGQG